MYVFIDLPIFVVFIGDILESFMYYEVRDIFKGETNVVF